MFQAGVGSAGAFGSAGFGFRVRNGGNDYQGTLGAVNTDVNLFVVKIELSDTPGGDALTMWRNPDLSSGEPGGGVTVSGFDMEIDGFGVMRNGNTSYTFDELRMGTTWDDVTVTPIPEPGCAVLGALGLGLFGCALRKRRI